jgi:cytochrome c551/c552
MLLDKNKKDNNYMKELAKCLLSYSKINVFKTIFIIVLFLMAGVSFSQDGEKLFKQNCAACHTVTDKKMVGPGLKGVTEKRSEEWLLKWTKNSGELIASGDADAKAIFDEFKIPMPPFAISDEEIKAIYAYVKSPEQKAEGTASAEKNTNTTNAVAEEVTNNSEGGMSLTAIIILIVVGLMLLLALIVKANASKITQQAGGAASSGGILANNKKIFAVLFIVLALFGLKGLWDTLFNIGVSQGFQPIQPIKFSHKVHVAQNKISCNYCHTGARNGKVAGIPPASTCMNCHKYVSEGPLTGTTEIAKIYQALDYNPETQSYGDNPKPIEWVRVHNLPDHAYFNHAQHVTVGKVECQTCHGPVEEMNEAKQFSPLTMGWCVECHRTTEVKMEGNSYYTKLHDKLKNKYKDQPITVDKMGGLDCSKCHY